MRSKAPLILIELVIMLTVFAFAAGLCSKAFVYSSNQAYESYMRDTAVRYAENAAQVIKSCGGDMENAAQILGADGDENGLSFEIKVNDRILVLNAERTEDPKNTAQNSIKAAQNSINTAQNTYPGAYLGTADIVVADKEKQEILSLTICWQEVNNRE